MKGDSLMKLNRVERIQVPRIFDAKQVTVTATGSAPVSSTGCFCPGNLALSGQLFVASSGRLSGAAGAVVQLVLVNPSDSPRTIQLVSVDFPTATGYFYEVSDYYFVKNPSVTGLTPVTVSNTNLASSTVSVAQVYAGVTTTLPAGTMTHDMVFSYLVYRDYLLGSWVVPPGTTLGLALHLASDAGEVSLTVMWAETP